MSTYFHKNTIRRCRNLKPWGETIVHTYTVFSVYFSTGVMVKRMYRSVCKTVSMKMSKKGEELRKITAHERKCDGIF